MKGLDPTPLEPEHRPSGRRVD